MFSPGTDKFPVDWSKSLRCHQHTWAESMISKDGQGFMFSSEFQPGFMRVLMSIACTANERRSPPELTCHPPRGFLVESKKMTAFCISVILGKAKG